METVFVVFLWLLLLVCCSADTMKYVNCSLSRNTPSLKHSNHCCEIAFTRRFENPEAIRRELKSADSCPEMGSSCRAVHKVPMWDGQKYICHCDPTFCYSWALDFNLEPPRAKANIKQAESKRVISFPSAASKLVPGLNLFTLVLFVLLNGIHSHSESGC